MVPVGRYRENLALCQSVKNIRGDIYECGVWRGGMMVGIPTLLAGNIRVYLFDSFEGLPAATELDGVTAKEYQEQKSDPHYFDKCKAEESFAQEVMNESGMDFTIVKGWFQDTIPVHRINNPRAVLRLDDYYNWDGCTFAVHDYLLKHKLPFRIKSKENGVSYLIKQVI